MKNAVTILFLAVFLIMSASLFWPLQGRLTGQVLKLADTDKEAHTVQTSGVATIGVKPDRARVFLEIETLAPTVKETRQQNVEKVKKVMAAIDGLKIAGLKTKTRSLDMKIIHSQYQNEGKLPTILGYRNTHAFSVLVSSDDPDKLAIAASQIVETALENGANGVQNIEFFKDDLTDAKREALTSATKDGLANAMALAAGANRKVSDVLTIDNSSYYTPTVGGFQIGGIQGFGGGGQPSNGIVTGLVEVTCSVNLKCTHTAPK